jgi:hypothetical protein
MELQPIVLSKRLVSKDPGSSVNFLLNGIPRLIGILSLNTPNLGLNPKFLQIFFFDTTETSVKSRRIM